MARLTVPAHENACTLATCASPPIAARALASRSAARVSPAACAMKPAIVSSSERTESATRIIESPHRDGACRSDEQYDDAGGARLLSVGNRFVRVVNHGVSARCFRVE